MTIFIGVAVLIGLYMAWTIGANDFANSMGSAVGSGSLKLRWAITLGALCELAGAILVGMYVSDTLRKGIVMPGQLIERLGEREAAALFMLGMACALLGSSVWTHLASWMGMPVSTTHAIVGAVTGFGVVAAGWSVVDWHKVGEIVMSWLISPLSGALMGYVIFKLISRFMLGRESPVQATIRYAPVVVFGVAIIVALSVFYKGHLIEAAGIQSRWLLGNRVLLLVFGLSAAVAALSWLLIARHLREADGRPLAEQLHRVERVFAPLVVVTSCSVAFAHGANDVANAIGPLAAVVDVARNGRLVMSKFVPIWILALGGFGIVLGLITYGHHVMKTIGHSITELTPSRGVAVNIAASSTVLFCSRLGWPVSTSHTLVGAIIGIGLARGLGAVNRDVVRNIVGSWLLTVPASAILTVILFVIARLCHVDLWLGRMLAG